MPYIGMNQPWIYMCSPSRSPLPPPSPSHPSGSFKKKKTISQVILTCRRVWVPRPVFLTLEQTPGSPGEGSASRLGAPQAVAPAPGTRLWEPGSGQLSQWTQILNEHGGGGGPWNHKKQAKGKDQEMLRWSPLLPHRDECPAPKGHRSTSLHVIRQPLRSLLILSLSITQSDRALSNTTMQVNDSVHSGKQAWAFN